MAGGTKDDPDDDQEDGLEVLFNVINRYAVLVAFGEGNDFQCKNFTKIVVTQRFNLSLDPEKRCHANVNSRNLEDN